MIKPLFIIRQLSVRRFPALLPGLAALLAFIITVFLTSCTIPLDPVNSTPRKSIAPVNLSRSVDPPEVDASPKETLDVGSFTISFSWYDTMDLINPNDPTDPAAAGDDKPLSSSDVFEEGRIYRVELLLTPNVGFEFSNPAADVGQFEDFGYNRGGKIISGEFLEDTEIKIKIGILFDPAKRVVDPVKMEELDLTGIAAPQADTVPQLVLNTEGLPFTAGRIVWTPSDAVFAYNVRYEATLKLERKSGYSFQGLDATTGIRHNGEKVEMFPTSPGPNTETIEVIIAFYPIEKMKLDLKGIAAPQADTAPQPELDTEGLPFTAGRIAWTPNDAVFRYGLTYQAVLNLTRNDEGYSFQGLDEEGVLHNGKRVVIFPGSPGPDTETIEVTITFDPYRVVDDSDNDGFSDEWEKANRFDPNDPADGGDVYVAAYGNDETGKGTEGVPYGTLAKAVWKANFSLGESVVVVMGELSEGSGDNGPDPDAPLDKGIFHITDTGEKNLTIRGRNTNAKLKRMTPVERSVLYLGPGTKVTLQDITITRGDTAEGGGIYLDGGELTLGEGAVITGNTGKEKGGGIYAVSATLTLLSGCAVQGNKGEDTGLGGGIYGEKTTVIMKDGAIADNHCGINVTASAGGMGGGIYLTDKSTFDMTGGEIIDNEAARGGGAAVNADSSFTMTNGVISGNTAAKHAGGVLVMGSKWTLKGGFITDNEITGESIPEQDKVTSGGGLMLDAGSTGIMEGGYISYNTIVLDADKHGGGVYLRGGSSFTMTGGEISNNTNTKFGGGIYLTGTGTTFTMTGGTIYGQNDTTDKANAAGNGKAVYDDTKSDADKPKNDTITQYP